MSNPIHIFHFVLISLFWGCSFFAIGIAVQHYPPFFAAFLRSFVGMALMTIYLLWRRGKIQKPKTWLQSFGAGFFTMGLAWVFLFWGEKHVSPALAAVLNATVPIFVTILSPLMTPEDRLSWNKWAGVLIGFLGVAIIFAPEISWNFSVYLEGLIAIILMAICYAIGVLWTRRIAKRTGNAINLFYQCLGSSLFLLVISIIFESPQSLQWSWPGALSILYLGIFSTAIAWLLFFRLIKEVGSVEASATTLCVPLVAIFLDIFFLKKWLKWNQGVGAIVILAAVFIIHWRQKNSKISIFQG